MFNELLVLGLIPGTNFQITFTELLMVVELGLVFYLLRRRHIIQEFKYYWIYIHFYILAKRSRQLRLPILYRYRQHRLGV